MGVDNMMAIAVIEYENEEGETSLLQDDDGYCMKKMRGDS